MLVTSLSLEINKVLEDGAALAIVVLGPHPRLQVRNARAVNTVKEGHIASSGLTGAPIAPPRPKVLAPGHERLIARLIGLDSPVRIRSWVWLRLGEIFLERDTLVNALLARDLGEGGCDLGEADLLRCDLEIETRGLREVVEEPEAVDADIIERNERNLAVR